MIKTAGAKLNAIKRLKNRLDMIDCKILINVMSHLNYCSTVWHFCEKVEIHKLEKLQERCIRFIYNDYTTEYFEILKNNECKTVYAKRISAMCCEIYKTKNKLNAGYMSDIYQADHQITQQEGEMIYIYRKQIFIHSD